MIDFSSKHLSSEDALSILPHAVLIVDQNGGIEFANLASENFLETSSSVLTRSKLSDIFPFDSPLLALVAKVKNIGVAAQEYDVDISTVRIGKRTVDTLVSPLGDGTDRLMVMLHERGMADKMTRQLTHQGSARSVRAVR